MAWLRPPRLPPQQGSVPPSSILSPSGLRTHLLPRSQPLPPALTAASLDSPTPMTSNSLLPALGISSGSAWGQAWPCALSSVPPNVTSGLHRGLLLFGPATLDHREIGLVRLFPSQPAQGSGDLWWGGSGGANPNVQSGCRVDLLAHTGWGVGEMKGGCGKDRG